MSAVNLAFFIYVRLWGVFPIYRYYIKVMAIAVHDENMVDFVQYRQNINAHCTFYCFVGIASEFYCKYSDHKYKLASLFV